MYNNHEYMQRQERIKWELIPLIGVILKVITINLFLDSAQFTRKCHHERFGDVSVKTSR